jgi:metal-responsive CopG/Arc/MetJ family transcriptional regulator
MLRINAILSESLVLELDRIARLEHKSRSEMLREAARNLIADYHRKQEELQRKARMREAMAIQDRLREKAGVWDGVAEVRKWRDEVR